MESKKLITDSAWSVGSHVFSLIIVLLANFLLARMMSPSEFGQLGIVMFFVSIFNVFTDGGLSGALIRKVKKRSLDYSTVFTFNLIVSILFFILVFICSGFIAKFYESEILNPALKVTSSILLISSLQTIPNVKLLENLNFKRRSILTMISTIFGGIVGLLLAYFFNFGLWALISMPIATVTLQTLLFNLSEGFYFDLQFDKNSFKELFGFGINTTIVTVLNLGFDNVYNLIIGKVFSLGQVGYFYQAKKLQDVPNNIVNNLSQGVFYSSLSKIQGDQERIKQSYSLISKSFLWLMGLVVLIVLLFGDSIIRILLGEKWLGAVFYIKILIVGSLFYTQELINKIIFKVYNKTKKLLQLELFKKTVQTVTLISGIYLKSLDILLYGYVVTNAFSYFINYFFTLKVLQSGNSEIRSMFKLILILLGLLMSAYFVYNNYNLFIFNVYSLITIFLYFLFSHLVGIIDLNNLAKKYFDHIQ